MNKTLANLEHARQETVVTIVTQLLNAVLFIVVYDCHYV